MRKNELQSLEELKSQYTGVWGPSDGHWLGLDFSYNGCEYRLHTGRMYDNKEQAGRSARFGLYRKTEKTDSNHPDAKLYDLLDERESLDELLNSTAIDGIPFSEIIMDDNTVLLGQD